MIVCDIVRNFEVFTNEVELKQSKNNEKTPRKTNEGYGFDRILFVHRQKVESSEKKTIRMYAGISSSIGSLLVFLNLLTYNFDIGEIFNIITLAAIGQVINTWLVITSAIISCLSVQGQSDLALLVIATTACFTTNISFTIVIVFWMINLRNMVWYQSYFLFGFIMNIVPPADIFMVTTI